MRQDVLDGTGSKRFRHLEERKSTGDFNGVGSLPRKCGFGAGSVAHM
jgi:hypothetical protein